jgi:hypothetical protein
MNVTGNPTFAWGGFIAWALGIVTIVTGLLVQLNTINTGSSGQLAISQGINTGLGYGILAAVLLAVGFVLWIINTSIDPKWKYLSIFALAFTSYIISNAALLSSCMQVQVISK